MDSQQNHQIMEVGHPVSSGELNSWRRGFTPQAEIWNGRMAMFGLLTGLGFLIIFNLLFP